MELTIKITEEMIQQAMENALASVEAETGMTIKQCVDKQKERIPVYYIDKEVFSAVDADEALAKLEAYEKEKEIKVGDVVESIYSGRLGVITQIKENGKFVLFMDGMAGELAHNDIKKTGKHIDISELLQKIGGAE